MSYRCQVCAAAVPPRTPRLVHPVRRPDGSTACEVNVCRTCHVNLASGWTLAALAAAHAEERRKREVVEVEVARPAPPPEPAPGPPAPPPRVNRPCTLGRPGAVVAGPVKLVKPQHRLFPQAPAAPQSAGPAPARRGRARRKAGDK